MSMAEFRNEYLHLTPLTAIELPSHRFLAENQPTPALDLTLFVEKILMQGLNFAKTFDDGKTFVSKGQKPSPPSIAKVESFLGKKVTFTYPGEAWSSRKSIHENKEGQGTASYSQFEAVLKKDHSKYEGNYTPNIFDTNELLTWDELKGQTIGQFKNIDMGVYEMFHGMPFPLKARIFITLVITAEYASNSFIVVQVPVNSLTFPEDFLDKVSHRGKGFREEARHKSTNKKLVEGRYTSIERVQAPVAAGESNAPNTTWECATASSAGGWIPQVLTNGAVPGELIKDVGYVVKYINSNKS